MGSIHIRCIWCLAVLLCFGGFFMSPSAWSEDTPSPIVALVNGEEINQGDFDRQLDRVMGELARRGRFVKKDQRPFLRKEVLEGLINRELLYQESLKKGIKIQEKSLDDQFEAVKKGFPNNDEFEKAIKKSNLTKAKIKAQIKKDMAINEFISSRVAKGISVSAIEIREYYDQNPNLFKEPEQIRARHILIKAESGADESERAKALKKITAIQKKVQEGEDFSSLAKEYSEDNSSVDGGDLGFFGKGAMVKPFEEAVWALKPGEVSDIVKTEFGYHLIQLVEKKPEIKRDFEAVQVKIGEYLKQKETRKELLALVAGLKENAKVERFLEAQQ